MRIVRYFRAGLKYLFSSSYRFYINARLGKYNNMPDDEYLSKMFEARLGKKLNLNNPTTYNEKLQWLKLYDRKKIYTTLVDKYEVKSHISNIIGDEYLIKTLGVWDNVEDIDFNLLPEKFVLKCTHDSGGVVICKDKKTLDIKSAKSILNKALKNNFYYIWREWPYKNVTPRIIAEEYMEDSETYDLKDYKFFCFDGNVRALFIATDRQDNTVDTKFDFFDSEFNHLNIRNGHPNAAVIPKKPLNFELMKVLASKLSKGIPHVRIDFYEVNGNVYFGEMTFFHWSGMVPFEPECWDKVFGDWIKLPINA